MTAIYSLHLWKLAARRPLAACSSPLRGARVLASRCGGWWLWGWSVHCVVTLRSRPFHRHPNHPRTCLGFPRHLLDKFCIWYWFCVCEMGVWGLGRRCGSSICVVTLRSRPFPIHPNHSHTCLGFSRLFGTSFAYNIDFAFLGWGVGRGGVRGGPSIVWWPWGQDLSIDTPITLVPALVPRRLRDKFCIIILTRNKAAFGRLCI